jgi:hypothetical protein
LGTRALHLEVTDAVGQSGVVVRAN